MEQTRIYPLGKKETAKPMRFPDASVVPANMLYPQDGTAFDMLSRFIEHEYVDPTDMYMRGMAAELGIVKGKPFAPDASARALLDKAALTATRMGHVMAYTPSPLVTKGLWYSDRHWINVFPGNATFTSDSFDYINARTAFFTYAYSTSPGMAVNMDNVGAKYPATFTDADGDFLNGSRSYMLHVPKDIPVALFWSVTVYDPISGSGLDNGQAFQSLNAMDKPVQNADGTTDIYFGPNSPGAGKNWLATIPSKGWFTIFRLYGPKKAFFDKTRKLNDIEKVKQSDSGAGCAAMPRYVASETEAAYKRRWRKKLKTETKSRSGLARAKVIASVCSKATNVFSGVWTMARFSFHTRKVSFPGTLRVWISITE